MVAAVRSGRFTDVYVLCPGWHPSWYSAVGWVDSAGNGTWAVGIRSALIEGATAQQIRQALRHRGRVFGVTAILFAIVLALFPLIPVELAPQTEASEIDTLIKRLAAEGMTVILVERLPDVGEREIAAREPMLEFVG